MLKEADMLIDNEQEDTAAEKNYLGRDLNHRAACCRGIHHMVARMLAQVLQTMYGCGFEYSVCKYLKHKHSVDNHDHKVEYHRAGEEIEGYMDQAWKRRRDWRWRVNNCAIHYKEENLRQWRDLLASPFSS